MFPPHERALGDGGEKKNSLFAGRNLRADLDSWWEAICLDALLLQSNENTDFTALMQVLTHCQRCSKGCVGLFTETFQLGYCRAVNTVFIWVLTESWLSSALVDSKPSLDFTTPAWLTVWVWAWSCIDLWDVILSPSIASLWRLYDTETTHASNHD